MKERRTFPVSSVELREDQSGDSTIKHARGLAARFNSYSEQMWGFKERIAPGFFADALQSSDVRALKNHDPNLVLARHTGASDDTLTLTETDEGLEFDASMDTRISYVNDLVLSMDRRDINQCSFAFSLPKTGGDRWTNYGDQLVRELVKAERIYDVTIATYPAYPETEAGVRAMRAIVHGLKDREEPSEEERAALALLQQEIERMLRASDALQKPGADELPDLPEQKPRNTEGNTRRRWQRRRTDDFIRYQSARLGLREAR